MGCAASNERFETATSRPSDASTTSIQHAIIGRDMTICTPYGVKPCVYVDWASTGRGLAHVERYMENEVLPRYASTYSMSCTIGSEIRAMREESRKIIARATNAMEDRDVVHFTGSSATAAVTKIVQSLGLNVPLPEGADESLRPIVFTSSYEHHSNLLPWRESVADVVTIDLSPVTGVCLTHLREQLHKYQHRKLKIGSFSVVSNVTGMVSAVNDIAALVHTFGGIVIFDYSVASPHVHVDMNPARGGRDGELIYKDAIVLAGHMYLGGPGVLIAKKAILSLNFDEEAMNNDCVLGDIKIGVAMKWHASQDIAWVVDQELTIYKRVYAALLAHPNICILRSAPANASIPHLPIFSFLIRYSTVSYGSSYDSAGLSAPMVTHNHFLHYNFVCALLNDLFGIQCRGGCMCAGPYSIQLLGITSSDSQLLETALLDKVEVLRPGYTRLSLPYWMSAQEIDYVVKAVKFVADHGYKFLSCYQFNANSGVWKHISAKTASHITSLSSYRSTLPRDTSLRRNSKELLLKESLEVAQDIVSKWKLCDSVSSGTVPEKYSALRWFAVCGDESLDVRCIVNPPEFDEVLHPQLDSFETFHPSSLASTALSPRYLHADDIIVTPPAPVSCNYYDASFETDESTPREVCSSPSQLMLSLSLGDVKSHN